MDDLDVARPPEFRLQDVDEPPVHLQRDHATGPACQQSREHPDAGADLDDGVGVADLGDPDDLLQDVGIAQEALAEPLARPDAVLTEKAQRALHGGLSS